MLPRFRVDAERFQRLEDNVVHGEISPALQGPASRRFPLRMLIVHSDNADAERCLQEFKAARFRVSADVVAAPEQFVKRLDSKYYDLVIVEYPTPHWRGLGPQEILTLKSIQIPLIFLTNGMQLERVAELITAGVADCVDRSHIGHLPIVVRRALRESHLREERDQSEKKLRHSEARYRALVGNLTYGICRCGKKGDFLDVNQALITMLGYSSREELLAAHHARDILGDPRQRERLLGHTGEAMGSIPVEIDWKRKDGTPVKVRLSGHEVNYESEDDSYEIIVEDVTQQRKLEDHLREQAAQDPLTGLANYRRLIEIIDAEIKRSERTRREFCVLFLDLDGLKKINDSFGHLVGSEALCRLADVLCNSGREMDTAARFGGDEFALVLPETGAAAAKLVARRICDSLAQDGRRPELSVSIGAAIYPQDGQNIETLLRSADAALYSRKNMAGGLHVLAPKRSAAPPQAPWRQASSGLNKSESEANISPCIPDFAKDAILTGKETIILQALVAGKSYRQLRNDLRMSAGPFLRLMLELREKTGTRDKPSLLEWAQRWTKAATHQAGVAKH
jgi:diguanylate cyclase (GGDEF)-like protein/PAS domain S-box-containing protein